MWEEMWKRTFNKDQRLIKGLNAMNQQEAKHMQSYPQKNVKKNYFIRIVVV